MDLFQFPDRDIMVTETVGDNCFDDRPVSTTQACTNLWHRDTFITRFPLTCDEILHLHFPCNLFHALINRIIAHVFLAIFAIELLSNAIEEHLSLERYEYL